MKYKFTGETKLHFGKTLKQIVCVTAFASVSVGEIGGWIERELNLSQYGDAWVSGDAEVYGKLKLLAGFFFGTRYKKEEVKFKEIIDDYELIYKGDAKFGEETEEVKMSNDELVAEMEKRGMVRNGKIIV